MSDDIQKNAIVQLEQENERMRDALEHIIILSSNIRWLSEKGKDAQFEKIIQESRAGLGIGDEK